MIGPAGPAETEAASARRPWRHNRTLTFAENNECPEIAESQCGCHTYVGAAVGGACVDPNDACDPERPCDSNDDCGPGSVCLDGCRHCSTPCKPA